MVESNKNSMTTYLQYGRLLVQPQPLVLGIGTSANDALMKCGSGIFTGAKFVKENAGMKTAIAVTAVGAVVAAPVVIAAAGFGAGGVVAGSAAAATQAAIGNVAAGSTFAALQSAGVLGLATSTKIGIGVAAGAAVPVIAKTAEVTKDVSCHVASSAVSAVKTAGPAAMKATKDAGWWAATGTFSAAKYVMMPVAMKTWDASTWAFGAAAGTATAFATTKIGLTASEVPIDAAVKASTTTMDSAVNAFKTCR